MDPLTSVGPGEATGNSPEVTASNRKRLDRKDTKNPGVASDGRSMPGYARVLLGCEIYVYIHIYIYIHVFMHFFLHFCLCIHTYTMQHV